MIAFLSGKIISYFEARVILKIPSGQGYIINVASTKNYLQNENVDFFILAIWRENGYELFGFETLDERNWTEKLTKVSGIGAKTASLIVYQLGVNKLQKAILQGDAQPLTEVKGLGQKGAKKIVLELKGATTDLELLDSGSKNPQFAIEFTEALAGLGYKRPEIVSVISSLKKQNLWIDSDLIGTIRKGLEMLAKHK